MSKHRAPEGTPTTGDGWTTTQKPQKLEVTVQTATGTHLLASTWNLFKSLRKS